MSPISSVADSGTEDERIIWEVEGDGSVCTVGQMGFFVRDTDSSSSDFTCSTDIVNDGEWHHVVATFDVDGNMTLYVDGTDNGNAAVTANSSGVKDFTGYPFYIGANNEQGTLANQLFDGTLDDVRVYNRALSEDEIERLYGLGR